MKNELSKHYEMLLGLDANWLVENVQLEMEQKRVEIRLKHSGKSLICPECKKPCARHDYAEERSWRHLDTMQFETRVIARIPRANCSECGVKTTEVPWAGKHSRFTLMFEAFAIHVLHACGNVENARKLLRIDWDAANQIMKRAVSRGMEVRELDQLEYVGIDEKSFGKGHDYVSVMTDITGSRVVEVVQGRDLKAANQLWKSIPESARKNIKAVATDMWRAFITSTKIFARQAALVFDRFHVSKHLNEAVDKVRRKENKALMQSGDERLKGTKQLWLFNHENIHPEKRESFDQLRREELETGKAWSIKEAFRHFWDYKYRGPAEKFFDFWCNWASRCRLKPMEEKAKMLKSHKDGIMNYCKHRITNAKAEGFNSKIQCTKYSARGLRSFESYRTRILFFCGKLDLLPKTIGH